ncbi:hypothetical protein P692DRAFT_201872325 [Suillus brevipes Sb2]|nr:hypothetical protein P692DRAFT_201872325 [Suillus brevipes Sb2]
MPPLYLSLLCRPLMPLVRLATHIHIYTHVLFLKTIIELPSVFKDSNVLAELISRNDFSRLLSSIAFPFELNLGRLLVRKHQTPPLCFLLHLPARHLRLRMFWARDELEMSSLGSRWGGLAYAVPSGTDDENSELLPSFKSFFACDSDIVGREAGFE